MTRGSDSTLGKGKEEEVAMCPHLNENPIPCFPELLSGEEVEKTVVKLTLEGRKEWTKSVFRGVFYLSLSHSVISCQQNIKFPYRS